MMQYQILHETQIDPPFLPCSTIKMGIVIINRTRPNLKELLLCEICKLFHKFIFLFMVSVLCYSRQHLRAIVLCHMQGYGLIH